MSRRRSQHKPRRKKHNVAPFRSGEESWSPAEIAAIKGVAHVADDAWDAILVGDGSAAGHGGACGWAARLYDRHRQSRRAFVGAASEGSCLLAELLPYVQAMLWYDRFCAPRMRRQLGRETLRIAIVCDSKTLVAQGQNLDAWLGDNRRLKSTRPIWLVLHHLAGKGYEFRWSWAKRSTLSANREADAMAVAARCRMEHGTREGDDG